MTQERDAQPGPRLRDVGEDGLLAQVFPLLPPAPATLLGPGDDAAVVAVPDGRVVVSTDVLVEGRHFRPDWSTGREVGRRAAAQNLADIAAMGARPVALVVALVAPPDLPVAWVLDLARGLADVCTPAGAGVVGGDLSGGTETVVAVTVHGDLDGRAPVTRSGARPGDVVAHAGHLGRSAAGLALLTADGVDLTAVAGAAELVRAYRTPEPPLAAGVVAAAAGATAMLDVSDGLLRDASRLALASGVDVHLDAPAHAVPADLALLGDAADAVAGDPQEWLLTGGEDHGLLATFPGPPPAPFRAIGTVRAVQGDTRSVLVDGVVRPGAAGWDHFRR